MNHLKPQYSTGEIIQPRDCITLDDESGTVEFVVTQDHPEWKSYWKDLGPGVMPVPSFGSVYVPFDDEDLSFISRG
jgi:hypothetical protein